MVFHVPLIYTALYFFLPEEALELWLHAPPPPHYFGIVISASPPPRPLNPYLVPDACLSPTLDPCFNGPLSRHPNSMYGKAEDDSIVASESGGDDFDTGFTQQ